jgi:hypothetical protein
MLAVAAIFITVTASPASANPILTVDHGVDQYGAQCFGVFLGPADFSYPYVVVCAGKLSPLDCPVYIDVDQQNGGVKACL